LVYKNGFWRKSSHSDEKSCNSCSICIPAGMDKSLATEAQHVESGAGQGRRKGQLHTKAVRALRAKILTGELPPGARLRENQLCEELGVSRTPVREALRTLAAEGLVDLLPNRSVVVSELHAPDLEHLFLVFGVVEGLAGELACS